MKDIKKHLRIPPLISDDNYLGAYIKICQKQILFVNKEDIFSLNKHKLPNNKSSILQISIEPFFLLTPDHPKIIPSY